MLAGTCIIILYCDVLVVCKVEGWAGLVKSKHSLVLLTAF